ncbi:MAG: hypothetical protein WBC92_18145 [Terracidiphilus sp.]
MGYRSFSQILLDMRVGRLLASNSGKDQEKSTAKYSFSGIVCAHLHAGSRCLCFGVDFLSLADFSRDVLRILTGVTKDGIESTCIREAKVAPTRFMPM